VFHRFVTNTNLSHYVACLDTEMYIDLCLSVMYIDTYGVAMTSRLLKIIGLFRKRDL